MAFDLYRDLHIRITDTCKETSYSGFETVFGEVTDPNFQEEYTFDEFVTAVADACECISGRYEFERHGFGFYVYFYGLVGDGEEILDGYIEGDYIAGPNMIDEANELLDKELSNV